MKYIKKPRSFSEQAEVLIGRGLIVSDPQELIAYLSRVNYYRLSGYFYSFKILDARTHAEKFEPETTFEMIRARYEFDRELRLLLMDAVERIEISILRTRLVETHTLQYGCFGYVDKINYNPKFSFAKFSKLIREIEINEVRSYEEFIKRYREKYTDEKYLPLWMAVELMSFGQLFTFFRYQHLSIIQKLSHRFDIYPPVMISWLHTLLYIRNACAHHVRLWNRPLPIRPKFPPKKRDPGWYYPTMIRNSHIFAAMTIIVYLLAYIDATDNWKKRIKQLIDNNPAIPLRTMGFPENWEDIPFWQ